MKHLLEEMKEKFSEKNQKRTRSKAEPQQNLELSQWYPVIKQEADTDPQPPSFFHPSYYLYMCDKVVAPNVSLASQYKDVAKATVKASEVNKSSPGQSEKKLSSGKHKKAASYPELSLEEQEKIDLKTVVEQPHKRLDPPVSTRSARGGKSERVSSKITRDSGRGEGGADARTLSPTLMKDISCEDDKGRIMEEVMKTYIKQQEKLNTILRRKQQLQMEVEMLSNSKAMKELTEEQQNLQKELECLQAEHAQRMEEFYFEQRDLEKKLDQVMKQKCSCDSNLEKDKEAEYAAQLAELRQRLDHAEADRQELQDELRQEREAREKLELMIKELKLQILKSSKNGKGK